MSVVINRRENVCAFRHFPPLELCHLQAKPVGLELHSYRAARRSGIGAAELARNQRCRVWHSRQTRSRAEKREVSVTVSQRATIAAL